MRALALIVPLALAGCGSGGGDNAKAGEPPARLPAGLYELSAEITQARRLDEQGAPLFKGETGERSTSSYCLGEAERMDPELFTGPDASCTYSSYYVRPGRINAEMDCQVPRGSGRASMRVEGSFTADGFEVRRTLGTSVLGGGNVRIESRLTGRRTGDCTPGPAAAQGNSAG